MTTARRYIVAILDTSSNIYSPMTHITSLGKKQMKNRFPGFTVLVERALRLSCVVGVVALAAACGGGQVDDESADDDTTMSVQEAVSGTRLPATTDRRGGIILSEKTRSGIILTEAVAPNVTEQ